MSVTIIITITIGPKKIQMGAFDLDIFG